MKDNKTILYIVLAFVAGAVIMGLIDANSPKPLFSSADYAGKGFEADTMYSDYDIMPPQSEYDLNSDFYLTNLDVQIERLCVTNLGGKECSLAMNDFNRNGELDAGDVVIINQAVSRVLYDLNFDGNHDKLDLQIQRDCAVGLGDQCSLIRNDFNNDGQINAPDVVMITNYINGSATSAK